jgi:hypothetical protein
VKDRNGPGADGQTCPRGLNVDTLSERGLFSNTVPSILPMRPVAGCGAPGGSASSVEQVADLESGFPVPFGVVAASVACGP